jgi:murein DD-endopeptidase MepM/ murein hydrolase activator NlpD
MAVRGVILSVRGKNMIDLPRIAKYTPPRYMRGLDIQAHGAAMHRYLKTGHLGAYRKQKERTQQTFGLAKRTLAKKAAAKAGLPQYGVIGPELYKKMWNAGAYDALAQLQLETYWKINPAYQLVYPHIGHSVVCQGLHPTAGLPGNWAIDFCAAGGTPVVAVEDCKIKKLSGHDPSLPPENLVGIWGWSIHYESSAGYRYFSTHYGKRFCSVGQTFSAGQVVGQVGSWPGNPGRSHTHLGVTSPFGESDARKRILLVAGAPRVGV